MDTNENPPPDRESIWSIPARWQTAYFTLFAIQNIAGMILVCWYEIAINTQDGEVETALNIIRWMGRVALGSAGFTITIMEVARIVMVIGGNLERWLRKREDERVERRVTERVNRAVAEAVDKAVAEAVDKAVDEAVAEARSETRAEIQRQLSEWNQRKLDAEARGELFIEPPPDFSANTDGGQTS